MAMHHAKFLNAHFLHIIAHLLGLRYAGKSIANHRCIALVNHISAHAQLHGGIIKPVPNFGVTLGWAPAIKKVNQVIVKRFYLNGRRGNSGGGFQVTTNQKSKQQNTN